MEKNQDVLCLKSHEKEIFKTIARFLTVVRASATPAFFYRVWNINDETILHQFSTFISKLCSDNIRLLEPAYGEIRLTSKGKEYYEKIMNVR